MADGRRSPKVSHSQHAFRPYTEHRRGIGAHDHHMRYSDPYIDRHVRYGDYNIPGESSSTMTRHSVSELHHNHNISPYDATSRVGPQSYRDSQHSPTETGYNMGFNTAIGQAVPVVNGHHQLPTDSRHHCSHRKGPKLDPPSSAPLPPQYEDHLKNSHKAYEFEDMRPNGVTFARKDQLEDKIQKKDKDKEDKTEMYCKDNSKEDMKDKSKEKEKKDDDEKKKKDKKDKDKKNKKKKKEKDSSSSSSSSSDSGPDSDNEKDTKKKKKKKSKEKDKSKKKVPAQEQIATEVVKTDRNAHRPAGQRRLQSKDGHMNFINDSGTQINYWGVKPEDMMDHMNKVVSGVLPQGSPPYGHLPIGHASGQVFPPAMDDSDEEEWDGRHLPYVSGDPYLTRGSTMFDDTMAQVSVHYNWYQKHIPSSHAMLFQC